MRFLICVQLKEGSFEVVIVVEVYASPNPKQIMVDALLNMDAIASLLGCGSAMMSPTKEKPEKKPDEPSTPVAGSVGASPLQSSPPSSHNAASPSGHF